MRFIRRRIGALSALGVLTGIAFFSSQEGPVLECKELILSFYIESPYKSPETNILRNSYQVATSSTNYYSERYLDY